MNLVKLLKKLSEYQTNNSDLSRSYLNTRFTVQICAPSSLKNVLSHSLKLVQAHIS